MKRYALVMLLLIALCGGATGQSAPKRIYLAADDHTDYMWTGNEAAYRQAFKEMIDYYLDQADATAGNPPAQQSRWNCDGSFWLRVYEQDRSEADFARLIGRVRDGHLSVPLNTLVSCYGGQPAEAVLRGMYYAGSLERRFQLNLPLVVAMENQTLPYGLGALWAGAGAKYSWRGVCGCATKVPNLGQREHEIYWWTGPDGSRILMKWNSLLQNNPQAIGGYAEARDPAATVDYLDTNSTFLARYPYRVIGAFGQGWDDLKTMTQTFVDAAQNKTTAERQVIVSNEQDFFEDFQLNYGDGLPSTGCSYGNEWDLYCASLAEVSSRVKRAVEKLRSAEALATLVSLKDPSFMTGRTSARDQAWIDLGLYWEHNWTGDGPTVGRDARAIWQKRLAGEIEQYVNTLAADGAQRLGAMIPNGGNSRRWLVFNPLSWTRTDVADLPVSDTDLLHVVDLESGLEAPSQRVTLDGQPMLRILARDVPPVGYKVFELRSGAAAMLPDTVTVNGNVIENEFYRITVAERGAITSLIDKTRGNREFVQVINGRALNDMGASATGALAVENVGPVSVTLRATAPEPLNHITRITLLRQSPRIEIRNDIEQNFSSVQTWGFSFALDSPEVWHEEVGAVILAKLTSDGGHYSPRNARYDWLTLNHFADISSQGVGMTLSNADAFFMRLGNSTISQLDTQTPQIKVLVGGQVDGPTLGMVNQDGDIHFMQRFALTAHDAFSPAEAMRFALEHQNPLVTAAISGGSGYPESSFSLLKVSNPDVLVWALKPAEEGIDHGLVTRLWNLSGEAGQATVTLAEHQITLARQLTHLELPLAQVMSTSNTMQASLAGRQLSTYGLELIGRPVHLSSFSVD